MTTTTATPAVTSTTNGWVALAVLAPIGAVLVAVLRYVLPYETIDSTEELVREGYADPGAMSLVLWLGLGAARRSRSCPAPSRSVAWCASSHRSSRPWR